MEKKSKFNNSTDNVFIDGYTHMSPAWLRHVSIIYATDYLDKSESVFILRCFLFSS